MLTKQHSDNTVTGLKPMTKFKAVLSDIDGTLADSEGLALKAFQKVCTQLGAEMSHEEADTYIGGLRRQIRTSTSSLRSRYRVRRLL